MEIHAIAMTMPDMRETPEGQNHFQRLKDSIAEIGQQESIKILKNQIVDGRHRYYACEELGETPWFEELPEDTDLVKYVWAYNMNRRHFIGDQEAISIGKLQAYAWSVGRPKNDSSMPTQTQIAKERGIHRQDLSMATTLINEAPDLANAIEQNPTKIKLQATYPIRNEPEEDRKEAIERTIKGVAINPKAGIKQIQQERENEAKQIAAQYLPPNEKFEIHKLSVKDLQSVVEAHSLDFIITDPPYGKDYVTTYGVWTDLRDFALHALKPGGQMAVLLGNHRIPSKLNYLTHLDLDFRLLSAIYHEGGVARDNAKNTNWRCKYWAIYGYFPNEMAVKYPDMIEHNYSLAPAKKPEEVVNEWEQTESSMKNFMDLLLEGKGRKIICDPFMGWGTTGVIAVREGHYFIGGDIQEDRINVAKVRINEVA